ncbi:phage baseplate assembly protein V [Pseudomonas saudiphocaensis]|uniref:Phage P2 baseplate assembly gpV-like protein n=1 Tax=Pseudomonas saudiphocaensis TaxID=1499686 RepID=A0A078LUM8_9PSED|nr:phage baseplate assembly protein V [Pseudomonas saudiphocaensis]CDZ93581.1 phage P2 baseplate assembly gpV-like protein [Pseudomonas saudiphocaensis]
MNITDLMRRLENLIRLGTIAAVDHQAARCTVKSGGLSIPNLPWLAQRAGSSSDWDPPTVGEQCILFSPSGEPAQGIVLVGLYSQQRPAPSNSANLRRRTYPDGAVIDYDHAIHMLTATLPEGGKVKLIAPDGVSIIGNVDIEGLLRASEDVIAGDISLVNHRTKGVTPGNGVSLEPTP